MRLETFKAKGIGASFRDQVEVDLRPFEGKTIAVVGVNGAGKSTFLECFGPGAIYRDTPTRGSLVGLAIARDSYIETQLVNGAPWTLRHTMDAVSGKGESVVLDANGQPVLESTSVRAFDKWAAKTLPPAEVLFSTMFAPQGAAGFLGMKRADRVAVLLRVLGVERLEKLAERARKHTTSATNAHATLAARIADERARSGDVATAESIVQALIERVAAGEQDIAQARAELTAAQVEAERVRGLRAARTELEQQLAVLQGRLAAERQKVDNLAERVRNNRDVLADAGAIRSAANDLENTRGKWRALEALRSSCTAEAQSAVQAMVDLERQHREAQRRLEQARVRIRDASRVRDAVERVEEGRRERAVAAQELAALEHTFEELTSTRLAGAEERIDELRAGLGQIAGAGDEADGAALRSLAEATLAADDAAVREAVDVPARIAAAAEEITTARLHFDNGERELRDLEVLAARLPEIEEAERSERSAASEVVDLWARVEEAKAAAQEKREQTEAYGVQIDEQKAKLAELEKKAARAEPLARAEARLAEIEPQLKEAEIEVSALGQAIQDLRGRLGAPPPAEPDVAAAEQRLATVEGHQRIDTGQLAVARKAVETARAGAQRLAELDRERVELEAEVADWTRLSDDLGRDGLQALLIDAAGPELTALVNDLLRNCHGSRFTVRIDTQRASADGKKMVEGCDVVVLDSVKGREAEASTFSGGEKVILGEAMSLALSMLACRAQGVTAPTLVRDETGAALDPENARVYVAMLRRAQLLLGAAHVLFVSHARETWELADAQLRIEDGRISIVEN